MDVKINCENCKYWDSDKDIPFMGVCYRYAHPVEGPESMDATWPRTKNEDWCGEWSAKMEIQKDA